MEDERLLDKMIGLAREGLHTDGGHHKQWYLEQLLECLLGQEEFETEKAQGSWEPGIPA